VSWNDLRLRIRALVSRARVERELEDEVDFHLAMARRKHAAAGHSEEEAARLARLDFGRAGAVKEDCRDVRGLQALETALQDVRYALRSFRRSPGFVFTVAGTIALGLGLNTALFTVFNAYVLRPISVRDPYSLYGFTWTNREGSGHQFSWGEYRQFEKNNPAFSEVAAVQFLFTRLDGRPLQGQLVTGNYFQMLGVGPALGRTLLPEDAAGPGRDPVLVLSYQTWQIVFAGRPDIIGTKILIRGYPMEVIGVARRGFQDLSEVPRDFWAPLTMAGRLQDGADPSAAQHAERFDIVGRIRRGQSTSGAEAALLAWSRQMTSHLPEDQKAAGVLLLSKATAIPLTAELLMVFSPLAAAFGLVLLLACTNVANMMLARAMARQREIGIRLSLGAARTRLIRQLLTESILLSIPAAMLALAVSEVTTGAALRAMFATVPKDMLELIHAVPLPLDWRVFGFMLLAALASAFLFGLAPAIQATRGDVMFAARGEFTADVRPVRLRNGLVIAQIAVCTLLLLACGALVRTTIAMSAFDIGFHTRGVIAMNIVEKGRTRALDALSSDAGVNTMAAASSIPLGGLVPGVTASGQNGSAIGAACNYVSPEYFGILGIPIFRGRNFTPAEAVSGLPVGILSAAAARRLFPNANSVGQAIHLTGKPAGEVRVIGVAGDIVTCCIPYGKDAALLYLPTAASTAHRALLVHVRGDVEAERRRLDARLGALAPGAVEDIHSLDQYLAAGIYPFRAAAWIAFAVGGLALLLTVSGIYGVLSYSVIQRTKEIGIRVALGATTGNVTGLVLKQSLRLTAIGIGLGAPLALGLFRLLASKIVFMRVFDLAVFGAGLLLVGSAALAAGYIPSRKAARIDPIQTLRRD
jgi:predicted permease